MSIMYDREISPLFRRASLFLSFPVPKFEYPVISTLLDYI